MNTAAQLPPASLIICSRNRRELLAETVESILRGNALPNELIIVDQSDVPHPALSSTRPVRGCTIKYLWTRSIGLSLANNVGIAATRQDILVFTHDDVLVTPAWFSTLVLALVAAGPRTVVTGKVLPTEAEGPDTFVPWSKVDDIPATHEGRLQTDVLLPLNMAMYRRAIEEVGGFDVRLGPGTRFPAAEDNDVGFRLLEGGYRIVYVPEAALFHRAWRPTRDYLGLRWSYGRGQGAYYAKYLSLRDRHMLKRMVWNVKNRLLQAVFRLRRERLRATGDALYALGILSGAAEWLLTQRRGR